MNSLAISSFAHVPLMATAQSWRLIKYPTDAFSGATFSADAQPAATHTTKKSIIPTIIPRSTIKVWDRKAKRRLLGSVS
jgi:hypothetical protein